MCGIILYIDKLAVDCPGHLSLEPVYFTLSLFDQKTHNKAQAWHPLGYIPSIGIMSKAKSRHSMTSSQKVQLYHDILLHILDPLIQLQQANAVPFPLLYCGQHYNLNLKFPFLLAVLGDTESHDCLCGCYNICSIQTALCTIASVVATTFTASRWLGYAATVTHPRSRQLRWTITGLTFYQPILQPLLLLGTLQEV
jgi:hypothetical protein